MRSGTTLEVRRASALRILTSVIVAIVTFAASILPSMAEDLELEADREATPTLEVADTAPTGAYEDRDIALVSAPSPIPVEEEDVWGFRVAVPLYVWWPNLRGSTVVHFEDADGDPAGERINFHLNHGEVFDLIFSDLNGIYFFFGEARRKRLTARLDLIYLGFDHVSEADINESLPGRFLDLDQDIGITLLNPSVSHQVFETPLNIGPLDSFEFGLSAGFRYLYLQFKAKVSDTEIPGLDGQTVLDVTEHFWEVFPVGAEFRLGLYDKWSLRGRLLLGGWGMVDAKKGTDGMADVIVGYQLREHFSFEVGMRWLDLNVKGNDMDWEMRNMWGPTVALIANF
jgi:hypothetical protein